MILDTSGWLAALDRDQPSHAQARAALESDDGPYVVSPFVLAELDYLLRTRGPSGVADDVLSDIEHGAYDLAPFGPGDIGTASAVIHRYADFDLGVADASVVVLAARHRTTRLLTLDERHFRAVRPLRGRSFTILPADV